MYKKTELLYLGYITNGGMVTYWQNVIRESDDVLWIIVSYQKESNVTHYFGNFKNVIEYSYKAYYIAAIRLYRLYSSYKLKSILVCAGINELYIFPTLVFLKLYDREVVIKGIYLNARLLSNTIKEDLFVAIISLMAKLHNDNIFISDSTKRYWSLIRGKSNPLPVFVGSCNKSLKHNPKNIAFVGRHSWEKGPDLFLQVVKQYQEKGKLKLNFIMTSCGPMTEDLKRKANLSVLFTGWQENREDVYKDIDLILITSREEGYPLVCLEALERAIPVIGFNVGGVNEILKNENLEWLVTVGDVYGLEKKLEQFTSDYLNNYNKYFQVQTRYQKDRLLSTKENMVKKWIDVIIR